MTQLFRKHNGVLALLYVTMMLMVRGREVDHVSVKLL